MLWKINLNYVENVLYEVVGSSEKMLIFKFNIIKNSFWVFMEWVGYWCELKVKNCDEIL